ncbi:MAG: hypothetical protein R2789_11395 [Microthrixaceae bacterium]
MKELLAESLSAGGLGFSTTRARTHSDGDDEPVASRWATEDEVIALAEVVAQHEGTTLEFASDGCLDGFEDAEVDFMIRFSRAGQRPLNWNIAHRRQPRTRGATAISWPPWTAAARRVPGSWRSRCR